VALAEGDEQGQSSQDAPVATNAVEPVDLRTISPTSGTGLPGGGVDGSAQRSSSVTLSSTKTYNFSITQEKLALRILWILMGIIGAVFCLSLVMGSVCLVSSGQCKAAGEGLQLVIGTTKELFTAIIGLVGSVVGFYFGQRDRDSSS
jgi:hypothetical protein